MCRKESSTVPGSAQSVAYADNILEGASVSLSALYIIYIICGMFTMQDTLITN